MSYYVCHEMSVHNYVYIHTNMHVPTQYIDPCMKNIFHTFLHRIIGLYVSVVLVIGRLIRGYISSLPSQLLIDEIVNPNPLLKLCKDIFTVREGKDFKLEEILVGKLFAIFRSPERLVQLTDNTKKKKD